MKKISKFYFILFYFIFFTLLNFYFCFILLYNTVLVLPYIDMNPPQVYMCSQTWTHPIKIKSFYTTKESISKVKRQPSEWENIFANDVTEKGLIVNNTNSS